MAGYKTDRKHVPHCRGLKKASWSRISGWQAFGTSSSTCPCVTSSTALAQTPCATGEASHADANGALDAAVKAKIQNYQHDYNERNFFFLPAVMTTSWRISCDFLHLLYIMSNRQAHNSNNVDPLVSGFGQIYFTVKYI
jgi:hypothetical protein